LQYIHYNFNTFNLMVTIILKRNYILLIALAALLVACSNNVEDVNDDNSTAAFQIDRVSALNMTLKSDGISKDWREIKNLAAVTLQTCLKDSVFRGLPILGEKFQITSSLSKQVIQSDANGCLEWKEQLEFNYLSPEKFYLVHYTLEGLGNFQGQVGFKIGINPWLESTAGVVEDPEKNWAEEKSINDDYYTEKSRTEEQNLTLNSAVITFLKKEQLASEQKQFLHYRVDLTTSFKRLGLNSEVLQTPIQVGRYHLDLSLYQKLPGREKVLISSASLKDLKGSNGHIPGTFRFLIPNHVKQVNAALLEVAVRLTPINAPLSLGPVEVLLVIDSITNPLVKDLIDDVPANTLIEAPTKEAEPLKLTDEKEENPLPEDLNTEIAEEVVETDLEEPSEESHFGYAVKKVELNRGSIVSANYNQSSKKTVRAKFKLCLIDPLSADGNSPIQNSKFKIDIELGNGLSDQVTEKRSYPVDNAGCFDSYAHIPFDRYDREHFIPFKIKITALTAPYKGIQKARTVVINPWNPADFGYDLKFEKEPAKINGPAPRIHFDSVEYSKEGINYDSFRLNEYLHLSFKKKYQISFGPKIEIFSSYKDEADTDKLTFGKYNLSVMIASPKSGEINYLTPNLENFNFFSAAEVEVEIGPSGLVQTDIELPMMISDSYLLSYKNLMILTLKPKDTNSLLRPVTQVLPFFGNSKKATLHSSLYDNSIPEGFLAKASKLIKSKAIKMAVVEISALEKYQDYFKNGPDSKKMKSAISSNLEEINKLPPIDGKWEKRSNYNFDKWYQKLNYEDLELMTNGSQKIANSRLKKICRHFHPLPRTTRAGESHQGGEAFQSCLKSPKDFMKFTPITHIQRIRSKKRIRDKDRKIIDSFSIGNFKKSIPQIGKVHRGKAFFAAHGDYTWDSDGHGQRAATEKKVSYGLEFPGPYFIGYTEGASWQSDTFSTHSTVKTEAYFDRNYTQLEKVDLDYNALTLEFSAQVRKCVVFESRKNTKRKLHLCRDRDEPEFISETWYFIGNVNADDHGIIVDGTRPGATDQSQIIRGKANFERMWGEFKNEDTNLVISEIGAVNLEGTFAKYKNVENDLPIENILDNSFPGLFIPLEKF
jgi:hypothetical protein